MANLFIVQEQLRVIKSGTDVEKKNSLTPESIADVREYITGERSKRVNGGTHQSLEQQFDEWEKLIGNYEKDKGTIVKDTRNAVVETPRSREVRLSQDIVGFDANGKEPTSITMGTIILLSLPSNDKTIQLAGTDVLITEVMIGTKKIWVKKGDLLLYLRDSRPVGPTGGANQPGTNSEAQGNSGNIAAYKQKLESEITGPVTPESLSKYFKLLEGEKNLDNRTLLINLVWSTLAQEKYVVSIQNKKIVVQNSANTPQAIALEATLNNHLQGGKFSIAEIQSAIMTGTKSFGSYVETQGADPTKASIQGYVEFLTKTLGIPVSQNKNQNIALIQKHPTATPEEKAFLISYYSDSYQGYNITPDVQRKITLKKQDIELRTSGTLAQTETTIDRASGGGVASEREQMSKGGKAEELTIETFMDNPMRAITKYPWTSLALIGASIWQFGLGKTFFGIFAAFLGIKAVNELAGTKLGEELKSGMTKGANKVVDAAKGAVGGSSNSKGDTAKGEGEKGDDKKGGEAKKELTQAQTYLRKFVMEDADLTAKVNNLATAKGTPSPGKIEDYVNYIEKDLKDTPLSKLFPSDHTKSIFHDSVNADISPDGKLGMKMLKRVLRAYLVGKGYDTLSGTGDTQGVKEKDEFLKLVNITEEDIKSKNLSDVLNQIQLKRSSSGEKPEAKKEEPKQKPEVKSEGPKSYKIGGIDVEIGKNVQINTEVTPKDDKGTDLAMKISPGSVVKIGEILKINNIEFIKIIYGGKEMYVPISVLKAIPKK